MASSSDSPFDKVARDANSDEDIYNSHIANYPNRVWFCIASVILFVTLCRFTSLPWNIRSGMQTHARPRIRGVVQYSRLPAAMLNAFRAIAFRWTVPISNSYTLNLAEVFLTAAYITVLFTWSLVNCKSEPPLLLWIIQHSFPFRSDGSGRGQVRSRVLVGRHSCHRCFTTSVDNRVGYQEQCHCM